MLNCKQVSRLVSQAMDAKLPWHQRVAMRFHLLYCSWCRRYAAQIKFLRRASRELPKETKDAERPTLSNDAKERMRQRLHEALKDSPSAPE
jgi:hypothetical protein